MDRGSLEGRHVVQETVNATKGERGKRGYQRCRFVAGTIVPLALAVQFGLAGAVDPAAPAADQAEGSDLEVDPGAVNSTDTPPVNSTDTGGAGEPGDQGDTETAEERAIMAQLEAEAAAKEGTGG